MAYQFLNRDIQLPTSPADIEQRMDDRGDDWMMTDAERSTLRSLLSGLKPRCAIEVGVYKAGSLAVLSSYCEKVYALDIDPACKTEYASKFPNVEFITGPSQDTLPKLIERIQTSGEPLEFVLIDANHSRQGVRRDVDNVLRYIPANPLYIIMHDSFNPGCRQGMRDASWAANPHVHMVELDFVTGRFVTREETDIYRHMWCGFGLAMLLPEKRIGRVIIHENESLMFQTALRHSVYQAEKWWNPAYAARELRYHAKRLIRCGYQTYLQWLRRDSR